MSFTHSYSLLTHFLEIDFTEATSSSTFKILGSGPTGVIANRLICGWLFV